MTKVKDPSAWSQMFAQAQNFYWDNDRFERRFSKDESFCTNFNIAQNSVVEFISAGITRNLDKPELVHRVFAQICRVITLPHTSSEFMSACYERSFWADIYKVCLFQTLCSFLHASRRIERMSIRQFVYNNHPYKFNDPKSPNYEAEDIIISETNRRRKIRNRILSHNDVYVNPPQWAAIAKDIIHENTFIYFWDSTDEAMQETYKRLGNLYNDFYKINDSTNSSKYLENLNEAKEKFLSKLRKIKYENFLKLQDAIRTHICNNKEYYGLNMYRWERRIRPYTIIHEVNCLLACNTCQEEMEYLIKTIILNDIVYPPIYKDFSSLSEPSMEWCAAVFPQFLHDISLLSCLIFDKIVEIGTFGDDWENLFRTLMNELAEDVLYDPSQLDFSIREGSQEKFEELLAAPVFFTLSGDGDTV